MASYLQKAQQGQQQAQAPLTPAAPVASAPMQLSMPQPQTGPATSHDDVTQSQASSPVDSVANFVGSDLPRGGNVTASSHGAGSPFGVGFADPAAAAKIAAGLSNLVYSVPAGGYITNADAQNANSYYNKFRIDPEHPQGGNPAANLQAAQIYRELGSLATTPNLTRSAARLNAEQGTAPAQQPSFTERLQQGGGSGPWGGPWEFPGWHLGKNSVFAPTF